MSDTQNPFDSHTLRSFDLGTGKEGSYYSLPALEKAGAGPISKLPVSIRLVLESVLRNCDGKRVSEAAVRALANWKPVEERTEEIPFVVARIVLQDFTGVPLLVDLAAMRQAGQESQDHRAARARGPRRGSLGAGGFLRRQRFDGTQPRS
jgi:aconitate hydratase